ncbi:DNA repair protein RecN [Akkermansiaceae bacterium]|nr:DNA repair protein RecN [Akkermansiaceae bacterium]
MLTLLKITNLALVDSLTWNIGSGLIGVTGETGAGKSVIVGALKLILGERADKGLIRTGESSCSVEAVFEISEKSIIWEILEKYGIELEDENTLIVKRVIGSYSNKQFVNNSPCTLNVLKSIGEHLVDLHGPHDHQSLHSNDRQLAMLDAYADAMPLAIKYRKAYSEWNQKKKQLDHLISSDLAGDHEMELLKFQIEEIESAEIDLEGEQELEESYKIALNSSKLIHTAGKMSSTLSSGIVQQLADIQRNARELERLDPTAAEMFSGIDSAIMEITELEHTLIDYLEKADIDPSVFAQLEDKINTYENLKRKYGPSLHDVVEHQRKASEKMAGYENRDSRIDELTAALDASYIDLEKVAHQLTAKRKKLAPKLAKEISSQLKDLGFKQAAFELKIEGFKKPEPNGFEGVDFMFGPNPGEPLKPLKNIASSGEISRVMLAVKSSLASQDFTSLMVFDEIDANVGGEIARAVGQKMSVLGQQNQVISITHFPQVAAVADIHYLVEKTVEDGRTTSKLIQVEGEQRINELVRMLGGGDGKEAREMAQSLLIK